VVKDGVDGSKVGESRYKLCELRLVQEWKSSEHEVKM
jgi:hypothetical protein